MKIQLYLLLILFVIILLGNVNAININDIDCRDIIQCDSSSSEWDSGNLICVDSSASNPDTEEIIVTDIEIVGFCNATDTSSDCIDFESDFYEELSSNEVYHGNGYDRFGGITRCCLYNDTTVNRYGFINDFNSDRLNPISREWNMIDSDDNILDSCPTITYDPQDISQTTDLATFNISFKPFNHEYDQYVEPQFEVATIWAIQDYFLRNATNSYLYSDQIKEWIQSERGTFSFDIYDIFGFANILNLENVLEDEIEYIKDECTVYTMTGCTSITSTTFSCTANTGVNVKSDTAGFLEAFFNKYKTPLLMKLGHEWCTTDSTPECFTGSHYFETALGILNDNILTFQGMRQFTTRDISRIEGDWVINDYDGLFVICDDAEATQSISYHSVEGTDTHNKESDSYVFIKGETYYITPANNEVDVVTDDDLVHFDWTNNGGYDTEWEEIDDVAGVKEFPTTSTTSSSTFLTQVWGKGGTHAISNNYRVYDPYVNPDTEPLTGYTWSAYAGDDKIKFTPFGSSFTDTDKINYFCIDFNGNGTYDTAFVTDSSVSVSCTGITSGDITVSSSYSSLLNEEFTIYGSLTTTSLLDNDEYNAEIDSYQMTIKYGMDLYSASDYARLQYINYEITAPEENPIITAETVYDWNPNIYQNITFDHSDSEYDNDIIGICIDIEDDGTYDECIAKDVNLGEISSECGSPYGASVDCIDGGNSPENYDIKITYSDINNLNENTILSSLIAEYQYGTYLDDDTQDYQFKTPDFDTQINLIYPDNWTTYFHNGTIYFNSSNSDTYLGIEYICFDYNTEDYNTSVYNKCYSKDGTGYCGLSSCEVSTSPEDEIEYLNSSNYGYWTPFGFNIDITNATGKTSYMNILFSDIDGHNVTLEQSYIISRPIVDLGYYVLDANPTQDQNYIFNISGSMSENGLGGFCLSSKTWGLCDCIINSEAINLTTEITLDECSRLNIIDWNRTTDEESLKSYNYNIDWYSVNNFNEQSYQLTVYDMSLLNSDFFTPIHFTFQELSNEAEIKWKGSSCGFFYDITNASCDIYYNLEDSNTDNTQYVCWDYQNDTIYDKCISLDGIGKCGLPTCDTYAYPLNYTISINLNNSGAFGDYYVKALVNNGYKNSTDYKRYIIFNEGNNLIPKITSLEDDDLNNDFIIDANDWRDFQEDVSLNRSWFFRFSNIETDIIGSIEDIDFACWDELYSSGWDVCYGNNTACIYFCGLNTSNYNPFTSFYINSSNKQINTAYQVALYTGNSLINLQGGIRNEYVFNPISQDKVNAGRMLIFISIIFILLLAVFFILYLFLPFGFLVAIMVRLIYKSFK